ncbi:MAG: DNA polymerase III subunit gamma/tau [Phycisphaerae bacterium]|nr:DNA polymerase III subunit gamma/tau [Phycisphaerae bacterium]
MAYTVLARKYRSWTFDELVGQEAVATTLKNAIQSGRIHHGYLFCGTRGVGKTSAARILARSLNCLKAKGPTIKPCCKCESCVAIAEGQDMDVIEIDAASNTGVDNIRELRGNIVYRPARARFKIYIIDEVHMLSTGAFNALLKTLEEPPEHVKFILATTESQKVPATIQSRCLRFDFRSISADEIARHFEQILKQEKIEADPAVIRRVARLANGSMRDGLSLLDQLLSMGRDKLTLDMIDDVLPTPHDEVLTRLIGQLADHDAAGALVSLDQCLSAGYSLERLAESLAEQVRTLMLLAVCGPDTPLVDLPSGAAEGLLALSKRFDSEQYVYMISVLEELRRNVRFSALGRALLEAGIVRLASAVRYRSIQTLLDQLGSAAGPAGDDSSKKKVMAPPVADPATRSPQAAAGPGVRPGGLRDERPLGAAPTGPASRPPAWSAHAPGRSIPSGREPPPPQGAGPMARMPAGEKISPPARAAAHGASPAPRFSNGHDARPATASPPGPAGRHASPAAPTAPASAYDLRAAASDPAVRQALELFDGSLVNVERVR